jgi:endonuclease/exonuclease/phosphatase family metal-dependent hydrolase
VLRTPELKEVDVWLLNEFDLGMARSGQHHTVRLLAYALGLNYAWGVEFVELSNGNKEEQQRTSGQTNQHGLHGNAILSRWPLHEVEVVRMPGMAPLFNGTGSETAFGHEKRLGSRMTIFANTGPPASKLIVAATHTQTSWGRHKTHTSAVVQIMLSHLQGRVSGANASKWLMGKDASDPLVLLGGDTWPETCKWLGLRSMVRGRSPTAVVTQGKVVVTRNKPMDDYICGSAGFTTFGAPRRIAGVGHPTNGSGLPEFTLSDHVFVSTQLSWP